MMMNRPNRPTFGGIAPVSRPAGNTWSGPSMNATPGYGINPAGRRRPPPMPIQQQPQIEQPPMPTYNPQPQLEDPALPAYNPSQTFQPPQMQVSPSLPQGAQNLPAMYNGGNTPPWLRQLLQQYSSALGGYQNG